MSATPNAMNATSAISGNGDFEGSRNGANWTQSI